MNFSHKKLNNQYKYYPFLSMLYCTLLTVSVLFPYKIINFFGYSEPGGILIFPITYLLAGVIADRYGRTLAIRMVYSSICCLLVFNILVAIIIRIPSMPDAPNQAVFSQAFGSSLRLSFGCIAGLFCSDLTNVYKITGLKLIFGGKYFIYRCLWSTAISEAIFNFITYLITYLTILPIMSIFKLMLYSWVLKIIYSLFMVFPLLLFMSYLKKAEGADIYDVKVANPWINPEALLLKFLNASKNTHSNHPSDSQNRALWDNASH